MSKSLVDALDGGAWSVSEVIFDLDDMLDDEGRPVSERRADAAVRVGVEMDVRECPYPGIRHNQLMNASALAQVGKHYNDVLDEVAIFRSQVGGSNATWSDILAAVMDQLSRPAIWLLEQRDTSGPVPARTAVSHKLGAGFFGVMRTLHERIALGKTMPVSVEDFLALTDETGALLGASEACAGPAKMIRKASTVLVAGDTVDEPELDSARLDIARHLALQVELGVFWRLYDHTHYWAIVRGEIRQHLTPWNDYLARQMELAEHSLDTTEPGRPQGAALPHALRKESRQKLAAAIEDAPPDANLAEDLRVAGELLADGRSVIAYDGDTEALLLRIAHYLNAHRTFLAEISRLERDLREQLGYPVGSPIKLGAAAFPAANALPWYERILGRRVDESGRLTGDSVGIRIPVKAG